MKKIALKERQKQELYKAYGLDSDDDVDDVDDDYKKSDERDRLAYVEQCKQIALKKKGAVAPLEPLTKMKVAPLPKKEKKIKYVEQSESESEEEIIYVKKTKSKPEPLSVFPKIMFC